MASDDKKIKPDPAPKTNAQSNVGSTTDAAPPKADEGQKPVTKAYRDNWNLIFAKKNR